MINEFNDMMGAEPKIFKQYFKEFLDTFRTISQMNVTVDSLKTTALEIIVLSFEMLPAVPKNSPQYIQEALEAIFAYMITCVEDVDKEWMSPPEGRNLLY